jgi:heme/copper-type cytochrome/quinol oxidase subunit 2
MYQITKTTPQQRPSLAFFSAELFAGLLLCVALIAGVYFTLSNVLGKPSSLQTASAAQTTSIERHVQVHTDIIINQAGLKKDWPAYSTTNLVVPANSLVTVTIRNYDLGNTPLPSNSPFAKVQGTENGMALADGKIYTSLTPDKIAHTFTIPQLNVNVPIPGDGAKGATYTTVTFTFHTGKAGTYTFQCFDPCGTGPMGFMGPMMTKGYMTGTLTVQ